MRAAIVLAAGLSRRFGGRGKLFAPLAGQPLLIHALDRARESGVGRIIVVSGARRGLVARLLRGRDVRIVHARHYRDGMGESLRAGLAALRPIERELLVFLADMPFAAMPRGLRIPRGSDAVRPAIGRLPGHPLLAWTAVARRACTGGDRGFQERLCIAEVRGTRGNFVDIDTIAALRRARRGSLPPGRRSA